jgi:hypothetical protein
VDTVVATVVPVTQQFLTLPRRLRGSVYQRLGRGETMVEDTLFARIGHALRGSDG